MDALAVVGDVVRTSPPDGIHLTLHFLGHLELRRIDELDRAVEPVIVARPRFVVEVQGIDAFPSMARPRIVWAGITGTGRPRLLDLQSATGRALQAAGFVLEARPYAPHLTLGRLRRPPNPAERNGLKRWQSEAGAAVAGRLPVESVSLIRSELGFRPPRYTALRAYPLE